MVTLTVGRYREWRDAARALLGRDVPPENVTWLDASEQPALPFPAELLEGPLGANSAQVTRRFVTL